MPWYDFQRREYAYDAIFVDEGQDFRVEWWKALMKALVEGGEMLLCSDTAQNIYGISQAWTDNPTLGTRLAKPTELKVSYRMPGALCALAAVRGCLAPIRSSEVLRM